MFEWQNHKDNISNVGTEGVTFDAPLYILNFIFHQTFSIGDKSGLPAKPVRHQDFSYEALLL